MPTIPRTPDFDPAAAAATSTQPPPASSSATTAGEDVKAAFREAKESVKASAATIGQRFGEIREYASYYFSTKTDALKSKFTWLAIYAALGIVGAIVGVAILATAGVLFVRGIAHGLGAAFGRAWLGELVTGLGLLLLLGVGIVVGLKVLSGTFKRKLMEKYEQRHKDQRERFGADVLQRARESQQE